MGPLATTQLCLDSDIIIDYLRRRTDVLERALLHFNCALTAVTLYELEVGFMRSPRQRLLFDDLMDILVVLPLDKEAALSAAEIYVRLQAQGLPIGVQDTLIAGVCVAHNAPLLPQNVEHYGRVEDLQLVSVDDLPTA